MKFIKFLDQRRGWSREPNSVSGLTMFLVSKEKDEKENKWDEKRVEAKKSRERRERSKQTRKRNQVKRLTRTGMRFNGDECCVSVIVVFDTLWGNPLVKFLHLRLKMSGKDPCTKQYAWKERPTYMEEKIVQKEVPVRLREPIQVTFWTKTRCCQMIVKMTQVSLSR